MTVGMPLLPVASMNFLAVAPLMSAAMV